MDIKDLTGLSKPLIKLVEVISQGIGAISKPYLIKKTADAKAYEIKKIAETIKEHHLINLKKKKNVSIISSYIQCAGRKQFFR